MSDAAGKNLAGARSRHAGPDGGAFWALFQRQFFALTAIGVLLTTVYIFVFVLPTMGAGLSASPIIPGWQAFNNAILHLHIIYAIPPLLLGLFAFSTNARRWSPHLHRHLGTIYCICIWLSAVAGFLLAIANGHGFVAKAGFGSLALVWFMTTWQAYATARRKDFVTHRRWMIRSYAITLAVVSVRPMFLFGPPAGLDDATWYQIVTWLCWVPNLIVGEFYVRTTDYAGRLHLPKRRRRQA